MKKSILMVIAFCWSIITIAQEQNEAQVEVINGMEVYIINEPVRPYQVMSDSKQKLIGGVDLPVER